MPLLLPPYTCLMNFPSNLTMKETYYMGCVLCGYPCFPIVAFTRTWLTKWLNTMAFVGFYNMNLTPQLHNLGSLPRHKGVDYQGDLLNRNDQYEHILWLQYGYEASSRENPQPLSPQQILDYGMDWSKEMYYIEIMDQLDFKYVVMK